MGIETILAIIAACAIIAAVIMTSVAYRLNEQWAEICDKQNELLDSMNKERLKFYDSVRRGKNGD